MPSHACLRINRNIVECKYVIPIVYGPLYPVLIETLWNVNMTPFEYIGNVSRGINRNIVECKLITPLISL